MRHCSRRTFGIHLFAATLAPLAAFAPSAHALEIGDPAPAFNLPSTTGRNIALP